MKINVTLPIDRTDTAEEFWSFESLRRIVQALEGAGFHAACVTDHPCPTQRWLENGGHYAPDPFALLAFVGGVTTRLRLQTGIVVLPYRNPFITARAIATLDRYSGGRAIMSFGAGYLKGEYKALGVDFNQRNELFDEYLRALKPALSGEEFTFEGSGYVALGNRIVPGPIQRPHPPIYVGGNSPRAIRRAVDLADGWNPFFTHAALATTARTASMTCEEDLVRSLDYLRDYCVKVGRAKLPDIVLGSLTAPGQKASSQQLLDAIARYRDLGVTGAGYYVNGVTASEYCDNAQRFGEEVLSKLK